MTSNTRTTAPASKAGLRRPPGCLLSDMGVLMWLGLPAIWGYSRLPEPVGYFCFPLAFLSVAAFYLLLTPIWRSLLSWAAIWAGIAAYTLLITVIGVATRSPGWTLLAFFGLPFAALPVYLGFLLLRGGPRRGRKRPATAR